MPRIVGYQSVLSNVSWARVSALTVATSASQAALVVDDRLDLVLGQDLREVRHAAGRDPSRPVQLLRRLAGRDPVEVVLDAGRAGELTQGVSIGEVRAVRPTAHRPGKRPRRLGRIEERPVLRVAAGALQLEQELPITLARARGAR